LTPYYQEAGIAIYHGDCREIDAWLLADAMVTDPPYGMALASGWGGDFGDLSVANDEDTAARDEALSQWGDRPAIVFGRWSVPRPPNTRALLTWEKGDHTGMGDLSLPWKPTTEEIYVLGRGFAGIGRRSSVLRFMAPAPAAKQGRHHPTEKPLDLIRHLVACCPPPVVADPFMGSGTTLRAAKDIGRQAIGVEIEERYCEIAADRLRQSVLFAEAGA
jgi:DNA modification methylase